MDIAFLDVVRRALSQTGPRYTVKERVAKWLPEPRNRCHPPHGSRRVDLAHPIVAAVPHNPEQPLDGRRSSGTAKPMLSQIRCGRRPGWTWPGFNSLNGICESGRWKPWRLRFGVGQYCDHGWTCLIMGIEELGLPRRKLGAYKLASTSTFSLTFSPRKRPPWDGKELV